MTEQEEKMIDIIDQIKESLERMQELIMYKEIIPRNTKVIYKARNNCECYCGDFHPEDGTYDLYAGWNLCHVPRKDIEIAKGR